MLHDFEESVGSYSEDINRDFVAESDLLTTNRTVDAGDDESFWATNIETVATQLLRETLDTFRLPVSNIIANKYSCFG